MSEYILLENNLKLDSEERKPSLALHVLPQYRTANW